MVTRSGIEKAILSLIEEYSKLRVAHGKARYQKIMDKEQGIYQLKLLGWDGNRQIYGVIFDIELIKEKVWTHYDGTEDGIAVSLEANGIPKEQIVLAWLPLSRRKHTDYAEA